VQSCKGGITGCRTPRHHGSGRGAAHPVRVRCRWDSAGRSRRVAVSRPALYHPNALGAGVNGHALAARRNASQPAATRSNGSGRAVGAEERWICGGLGGAKGGSVADGCGSGHALRRIATGTGRYRGLQDGLQIHKVLFLLVVHPACHVGGRRFESRRSRHTEALGCEMRPGASCYCAARSWRESRARWRVVRPDAGSERSGPSGVPECPRAGETVLSMGTHWYPLIPVVARRGPIGGLQNGLRCAKPFWIGYGFPHRPADGKSLLDEARGWLLGVNSSSRAGDQVVADQLAAFRVHDVSARGQQFVGRQQGYLGGGSACRRSKRKSSPAPPTPSRLPLHGRGAQDRDVLSASDMHRM
jgi:hypothetical protein